MSALYLGAMEAVSPVRAPRSLRDPPNTFDTDDCINEAQRAMMERVAIDVQHVVSSLREVWNEVGYSVDERRLQMDKLSDELTQTLRAKLACEVEVRDVFKKDIVTKVRECEELVRVLGVRDNGPLNVQDMRLSHALMRLEEEHGRLAALRDDRLRKFDTAHGPMRLLARRLEVDLDRNLTKIGSMDLTVDRLAAFEAEVARLRVLEHERATEVAALCDQCRALRAELTSALQADDDYADAAKFGVGKSALIDLAHRLDALRAEKKDRLDILKGLGADITVLWSRLGVGPDQQTRFRERTREYGISQAAVEFGRSEKEALQKELKARVVDLVEARRKRMTELWDEMEIAPEARASFAPCAFVPSVMTTSTIVEEEDEEEDDDEEEEADAGPPKHKPAVFDEATLAAHDEKLAELEKRRSTLQPLLRLVEKLEELFEERTNLVQLQADPNRLTRRGPGAHAERKAEMEMERAVKQLPNIEDRLLKRIHEWEKTQGPFVWKGERYADRMARVEAAWEAKKTAEKLVKTAKKDAQHKKENFPNAAVA